MLYLVFDVDGGLGVDQELKSPYMSPDSSAHQKGLTSLWAIAVNSQQDSVNQPHHPEY